MAQTEIIVVLTEGLVRRSRFAALRSEEVANDFILLLGAKVDKRLAELPLAKHPELSQAQAIDLLQGYAEACHGSVYVVDDTGLGRPNVAVSPRNDALRDRLNGARFKVVEEDEGNRKVFCTATFHCFLHIGPSL
jgi:hypothetical protein